MTKRLLRALLVGVLGLLVIAVVALLFRNPLLKAFAEYRVRDATGLELSIGEWRSGITLTGTSIRDLRVLNTPRFGPEPLLLVPELRVELDASASIAGRIRFKEAWVHLSEFTVVRAEDGRLNLDEVERLVRERMHRHRAKRWFEADFAGIDRLHVTLGRVNFVDRRKPERSRVFELGITNELVTTIQSEEDFHAWLASLAVRLAVEELYRHPDGPRRKMLELIRNAVLRVMTQ